MTPRPASPATDDLTAMSTFFESAVSDSPEPR
jgi:hypothetical protein